MTQSPSTILRILLATIAVLALSARGAEAQNQAPGASMSSELAGQDIDARYSAGLALTAPIVATAASVALVSLGSSEDSDGLVKMGLVGLAIGPSLGHIYTKDYRGVLIGSGLRIGGGLAVAAGAAIAVGSSLGAGDGSGAAPLLLVGGAAALGGTIYSIVDAPFSARRANEKHRQMSVTPAPIQGPLHTTGWGANLSMKF